MIGNAFSHRKFEGLWLPLPYEPLYYSLYMPRTLERMPEKTINRMATAKLWWKGRKTCTPERFMRNSIRQLKISFCVFINWIYSVEYENPMDEIGLRVAREWNISEDRWQRISFIVICSFKWANISEFYVFGIAQFLPVQINVVVLSENDGERHAMCINRSMLFFPISSFVIPSFLSIFICV